MVSPPPPSSSSPPPSPPRRRLAIAIAIAAAVPAVIDGALAHARVLAAAPGGAIAGLAIAGLAALGLGLALGARLGAQLARGLEERAARQARLARGDREAAVGAMAARLAHDLHGPLAAVLGHARALRERAPEGPPDRAALDAIAAEAERLQAIAAGLREQARAPRPAEARACDVAAVVRHAAAMLGPELGRTGARLELAIEAAGAAAIEAPALQEVIVELVRRALRARPGAGAAGAIAISARPGPGGVATVIAISAGEPGGAGGGDADDDALAVCRHLIAMAGGALEAGARPGGGAELRVVLPLAPRS